MCCRRSRLANAAWVSLALLNFGGCLINKLGGAADANHILAKPATCAFAVICITGMCATLLTAIVAVP